MLHRLAGFTQRSGGFLLEAAAYPWRILSRRRPAAPEEEPEEELPPEVEGLFEEADQLAGIFRRRPRRLLLALAASTGAVALFGAGFVVRAAFFEASATSGQDSQQDAAQRLLEEIVPADGFTVEASWGDILPRLVEAGVIDVAKFEDAAQRAGAPLTEEQLRLLRAPSDEKLRIDRENTYFMLNVLWAVGLADAGTVLREGPMAQVGDETARLASTAGWRLGQEPGPDYLGSLDLIPLSPEQEQVVMHVASHSYRPCCNNPTAFPDCNHGAAALGLATIMASQGARADKIFRALKTFNAYWFPEAYYRLALFFDGQGTQWEDVDAEMVMGREYSSLAGANQVDAQLRAQGRLPQVQGGAGGSCAQ